MSKVMEEYVGKSAFNEFMQIMYEQLSAKAGADVVAQLKEKIDQMSAAEDYLLLDDIVATFEGFDPEAEGADRKVAAATLVKSVKDAVDALQNQFEAGVDADTLGGSTKDDFVAKTDVIDNWDNYNAEVMQVVAATLIKAMNDKITANETAITEVTDRVTAIEQTLDGAGTSGGYVVLDENGKVPASVLPSYVDDVQDVYVVENEDGTINVYTDAEHTTELVPETGKIYLDVTDPNVAGDSYRWSGTAFVNLGHPKLKEITADEVQAMWDSITVPSEDETETA